MHEVAIVGAGEIGSALAHILARLGVLSAIRLVDDNGTVAAGQALDIMQASAFDGFATKVCGSTDLAAAAGAALIIVADRQGCGDWKGTDGMALLARLSRIGSRSVIVCAGTQQGELVERGVGELHFARERLVGSAPEALAAAVRALVALETNGSPAEVALTILGVPPAQIVVPWEDAAIAGFAATRMLSEQARRGISARIAALWPPGPYALAWAAAQAVESVIGRSRRVVAAFVAPDASSGKRSRAAALPVRMGSTGISQIVTPTLTIRDRVALENAMAI